VPMTPSEKQRAYRDRQAALKRKPGMAADPKMVEPPTPARTVEEVKARLALIQSPPPATNAEKVELARLAKELRRPGDDDAMAERRARIAAGARSNYLTGDFVKEITAMTQQERDRILGKLPKTR
jgi:hypothetical protein